MSEQLIKMFEKLTNNLENDDPTKHMTFNSLTGDQEKIFENASEIISENTSGEIKKFGGSVNEEEFKKLEEEINKRLENAIFKPFIKDLEKSIKKWIELKKKEINSYVYAIIPVKEMPFPSVSFMTVPRIIWEKDKIDKMTLNTDGIAYIGEIQALVTRTVLYGKMGKEEPLFAPHIGQLDLADYKPDPNEKTPKSENVKFIHEIIDSIERKTTQNHVTRYDGQYERHGEPICDFLMKDEKLLKSLSTLTSAIDSKRQTSNAAIPAIVLPLINTSLVISLDESKGSKKYEITFEALLNLAAASYETPNVKKGASIQAQAAAMTRTASQNSQPGMGVGSMVPQASVAPAAPQLPVWTEEALAEETKKRGLPAANLPVWSEEELTEEAKKRGIDTNLPVWTEEDLEQEKKRRGGGFSIPEWEEDKKLNECPKCGYTCRPGWDECPSCGSAIEETTSKPQLKKESKSTEEKKKEPEKTLDAKNESGDKPS
ncbi:MAG: zinc ribbon domain-containing protein [archaeon]|nr:zinc ribbon domain-containing protein [archaeon]